MSNADTRAHVEISAMQLIPAVDLQISTPDASDDSDNAIAVTIPTSRKERRKQKKTKRDSALPTPSATDDETSSPSRTPPNNPSKKHRKNTTIDDSTSIPRSMPPVKTVVQNAYPLLICSIGNPGATYANTLHSAGHVLTSFLAERKSYTPFRKGLSGLMSRPDNTRTAWSFTKGLKRVESETQLPGEDWTFWQSTSLMNVSGAHVKKAYTEWLRSVKAQSGSSVEGRLVVIHDELESALGDVRVRDGGASAKGHNGLKSCQQSLGGVKWWRIGVGIGRPESRDPNVVSRYVLSKLSGSQKATLERSAVDVFAALEDIGSGRK